MHEIHPSTEITYIYLIKLNYLTFIVQPCPMLSH